MTEKKKICKRDNNNIPFHNPYDYSDTTEDFSESERLMEAELEHYLLCYSEYELECKLNRTHLCGVFSTKHL